jgi:DNA-binding transcriptional LysR family regulator
MTRNLMKLLECAMVLAEELHFTRAAIKMGISQPMFSTNIHNLELLVGGLLFIRDRKTVKLTDAGRVLVAQANISRLYSERALNAARAVLQNTDAPLYIGRSPYTDPFLVSTLLSIELPLYPRLRIELTSQYSYELVHDLMAGALDLAIATEPPDFPTLSKVQIAESSFYIAMAKRDELAGYPSVTLDRMADRWWILFERRLHPPLYDSILHLAEQRKVRPSKIQHVTAPEEAFPFVADGSALAFVVKTGALRVARNGVTVRPLAEPELRLRTYLASHADNDSKAASELLRAYMRKTGDRKKYKQMPLPISA